MSMRIRWARIADRLAVVAVMAAAVIEIGCGPAATPLPPLADAATAKVKPEQTLIATALCGGQGGGNFTEVHVDGLLVGFELALGNYGPGIYVVRAMRPIFHTPAGVKRGKMYGQPGRGVRPHTVVAQSGYAVGAVSVQSGDRIDAVQIHFMKVTDGLLDPTATYSSPWLGGRGGGEATKLGGDGKPVVGFFGRCGSELDAFGLVQSRKPVRVGAIRAIGPHGPGRP